MKIIARDRFRPGATRETITPYLPEEVADVWRRRRRWKAGIVRENDARAEQAGVVVVFEPDDVGQARRYTDEVPLPRAGLVEWLRVPVHAPLPVRALMDPSADVAEPLDRTAG